MKRESRENKSIGETVHIAEEEIPAKDEDGIDIIPQKPILENSDKTLVIKSNDLGRRS